MAEKKVIILDVETSGAVEGFENSKVFDLASICFLNL